jgi:maltose phosphorylase
MKEGWYSRSFRLPYLMELKLLSIHDVLGIDLDEVGIINYEITPLNKDAK